MTETMYVVEMETDNGWRYWSKPMPEAEVGNYIAEMKSYGDRYSDSDICTPEFLEAKNV